MKTRSNRQSKNKTFKANCHPGNKKNIHKNTCYTQRGLYEIKKMYNKAHHYNKIKCTSPYQIYNELRKRLSYCNKETCWMDEIKNPKIKHQLDKILFAPTSPKSWVKNKNEWLSNFDIQKVLKQYEMSNPDFFLLGPSSINYDTILPDKTCVWEDLCRLKLQDLINRKKTKLKIIFNLDKYHEPGSHWVAMFVDCTEKIILYFDSSVNRVPTEVKKLQNEIVRQGHHLISPIDFEIIENKHRFQTTNSECGMYCLFFIITMLSNKMPPSFQKVLKGGGMKYISNHLLMKQKIEMFTMPGINDKMMESFRPIYFNIPS